MPSGRCLPDLRVPFAANHAERAVRMITVGPQVSGCFRTDVCAQAGAGIRGSVSTLHVSGLPLLAAVQATVPGRPVLTSYET